MFFRRTVTTATTEAGLGLAGFLGIAIVLFVLIYGPVIAAAIATAVTILTMVLAGALALGCLAGLSWAGLAAYRRLNAAQGQSGGLRTSARRVELDVIEVDELAPVRRPQLGAGSFSAEQISRLTDDEFEALLIHLRRNQI